MDAVGKKKDKKQGKMHGQKRKNTTRHVESLPPAPKRQRKRAEPHSEASGEAPRNGRKVKVSSGKVAQWIHLPQSTRDYLGLVIDSSVLSILSQKMPAADQVQTHLILLKKKLLACCSQLKVPPGTLGNLKALRRAHSAERQRLDVTEESLASLQV
uniref:Centromere protein Q n=1 Tax=Latimeria chalumnae TaxID=7897 RepID=M3XH64_LATCH